LASAAASVSATDPVTGLTQAEAEARLRMEGANELPRPEHRTAFRIAVEVLREPMLVLLLSGGIIYLLLGDLQEALLLLVFGLMSIVITVVQETRTERVLEALRNLTSPRALVIRNGERRRIAGREVVRGDLVVVAEGDRVPADATLVDGRNVQADESLLTGESVPVRKRVAKTPVSADHQPGGDDQPFLYSGSLIVRGDGLAVVTATGPRSQIGKIGQSLQSLQPEPARLQQQTTRLVQLCAIGGAAVSIVAVLLYGLLRGGWLQALLGGVAIGMAMLPEEFPVVLTVFMAMGAWRISKVNVLTRRASAIETLGSATVLCSDKTGTLTENSMSVAEMRLLDGMRICPASEGDALVPECVELARCAMMASSPEPYDPMEKAFHVFARTALQGSPGCDWQLIHSYGLQPNLLAMSQVWRRSETPELFIAAKGAPETIGRLCRLDDKDQATLKAAVNEMAENGLRVLAVATAEFEGASLPQSQQVFAFRFLGLIGLADPLRASVPHAVRECRSAGIRVIMITGDYPATAKAIAKQAGLDASITATGEQIKAMDNVALAQFVTSANVFARITPDQKLRIVQALKSNGEIVAMTGDGVNDAPSLRAAHIGIAMGGRGTDVAREASSIVLIDDEFGSIVSAVRLGRRIYDNLRKAMAFIFAVHVPIAGLALLPLAFDMPLIFSPVHIAFLELIIDPVCSLVFEAEREERDVMKRPPRKPETPLFTWALITWSVLQGVLTFTVVAVVFVLALRNGMPPDEARALTFFSLVMCVVGLVLANRSFSASFASAFFRPNRALALILLAVSIILATTLLWSPASSLFRFGPLHPDDLMVTAGAGLVLLVLLELLKPVWSAKFRI
jgi:P-type Ca2+ transporter type 2C